MSTTNRNPRIRLVGTKEEELVLQAVDEAFKDNDKSAFGLLGIIGSFAHGDGRGYDIDLFSSPSEGTKPGELIVANARLLSSMRRYVMERGHHISAASKLMYQPETNYLAQQNAPDTKQLPIHNLIFTDSESVINITSQGFLDEIVNNIIPIAGNVDNLLHKKPFDPKALTGHYIVADSCLLMLDQLPEDLAPIKGAVLLEYLGKHYDPELKQEKVSRLKDATDARKLAEEVLRHFDDTLPYAA